MALSSKNTVAALLVSVQDSTDFPPQEVTPGLRQLDSALRCTICTEFLEAPVTLTCGHCFCSACLRVHLTEKPECPTCRKTASEGQIRPNPVVEDVVTAWKAARSHILRLISQVQRDENEYRTSKKRKRKTSPGEKKYSDTQLSSPIIPDSGMRNETQQEEYSDIEIQDVEPNSENNLPVPCPTCQRRVPFNDINAHLDKHMRGEDVSVDSKDKQKVAWTELFKPASDGGKKRKGKELANCEDPAEAEPLPKASYAVLKDKQIKDQLLEYGLWTTGDRNACIERHSRWVIMYNANLDRALAQRRSVAELRVELRSWEDETRRARANGQKGVKEVDYGSYERAHKGEFKELIEAARRSNRPDTKRGDDSHVKKNLSNGAVITVDSSGEDR